MAKLSYPNSDIQVYSSVIIADAKSNNDTLHHEQEQAPHAHQLQFLIRVARMRRRSQRQLLVQIEQEQRQQQTIFQQSKHCSVVGDATDMSPSCGAIIAEEDDNDNDEKGLETSSLSSSFSLNSNADDS
jgi:hypothetical protein